MINKNLLMEFFKDDDIKVVDKYFYIKSQMKNDVIKYINILEEENKELKRKITFNEKSRRKMQQSLMEQLEKQRKENERLKEELKNRPIVDFTFDTYKELENYKSRCEKIENNCIKSIESINKKLKENRELLYKTLYLNDYQVLRLKAIRMKCKEILQIIRGE